MDVINIEFQTEHDLYLAFMPFLKDGGLFIRSHIDYQLGDNVELNVLLPDSLEPSIVKAVVCWLTPVGVQNGTPSGVGVSFVDDPDKIRNQIEQSIARQLSSAEPTLTM